MPPNKRRPCKKRPLPRLPAPPRSTGLARPAGGGSCKQKMNIMKHFASCILLGLGTLQIADAAQQPNIVMILMDDYGW